MSRKWIGGLLTVAALAAAGVAATSVLGAEDGGDSPRPAYATVEVDLSEATPAAARPSSKPKKKKPKLTYLQSPAPVTINPAPTRRPAASARTSTWRSPAARRSSTAASCRAAADVFVQGSYVANASEYHVLIGLDDPSAIRATRTPFTINSHLICLKGVK